MVTIPSPGGLVVLTCSGTASGLSNSLPLNAFHLPPGRQGMVKWGGVGITTTTSVSTPPPWTCKDGLSGTVLPNFVSGWGEKVRLVGQNAGTRLTLSKSSY